MKNDKTYVTWDNNPKEANLEDEAIVLERLEAKLLGDHIHGANMPPPSTSRFSNTGVFPLSSQHPTSSSWWLCSTNISTYFYPFSSLIMGKEARSFSWQ
jgi:hypothetical protein